MLFAKKKLMRAFYIQFMKMKKTTLIKLSNSNKKRVKVRKQIKITIIIKMITTNSIKTMEENHLRNRKEKKRAGNYLNTIRL